MRKIVLYVLCVVVMFCVMNMSGSLFMEFKKDSVQDFALSTQLGILSLLSAGDVYADSAGQGGAVGHDKDKAQGNAYGHDKDHDKKPKKDKGKGPSLPALPMASSIVLGLGAIGWGRYLLKKHKG